MCFREGWLEELLGRVEALALLERKGASGWILRLEGLDSKSMFAVSVN